MAIVILLIFSTTFDVSLLMFDDLGFEFIQAVDALSKGVDFVELWKDMKRKPGEYASSAFSTTFMGLYAGAKRLNPWTTAAGGAAGAATGILGHYILTHNFEKVEKKPVKRPVKRKLVHT